MASKVSYQFILIQIWTSKVIIASNSLEITSSKFPKSSIVRDPLREFQFSLGHSLASVEVSEIISRAQLFTLTKVTSIQRTMKFSLIQPTVQQQPLQQQQQQQHQQNQLQQSLQSVTENDMMHFQQMAQLVHFLYTPLLFLPKWRYEAHSTRMR